MTLTVGSLFSGIGGIDLGLERAGMRVVWQSEIDPYACRVLAKHWPDVPNLGDVTKIDWSSVPHVDVLCGGYPCQPFSLAGARRGDSDARHLWPHMWDAIRHLGPRWVVLENVPGHLSLGFGEVLRDLAEIGYDAEWDCIPAAAVGAPHLRDRVFVVAYPHSESEPGGTVDAKPRPRVMGPDAFGSGLPLARQGQGQNGRTGPANGGRWGIEPDLGRVAHGVPAVLDGDLNAHKACLEEARTKGVPGTARLRALREYLASPAASSEHRRCDFCGHPLSELPCRGACAPWRLGSGGEADEDVRCLREGVLALLALAGQDVQPFLSFGVGADQCTQTMEHRIDRLRALGNAVVPQVAEHIGRLIVEAAA